MNGLTCSGKALESTKDGKKVNILCIIDQNHERPVVVLDHFRNFNDIQMMAEYSIENDDGIHIQGKANYCSIKKES